MLHNCFTELLDKFNTYTAQINTKVLLERDREIFSFLLYSPARPKSFWGLWQCELHSGKGTGQHPVRAVACWHEPGQADTNNTWSVVQRQLGSVVKARPLMKEHVRGAGDFNGWGQEGDLVWQIESFQCPQWYMLIPALTTFCGSV